MCFIEGYFCNIVLLWGYWDILLHLGSPPEFHIEFCCGTLFGWNRNLLIGFCYFVEELSFYFLSTDIEHSMEGLSFLFMICTYTKRITSPQVCLLNFNMVWHPNSPAESPNVEGRFFVISQAYALVLRLGLFKAIIELWMSWVWFHCGG